MLTPQFQEALARTTTLMAVLSALLSWFFYPLDRLGVPFSGWLAAGLFFLCVVYMLIARRIVVAWGETYGSTVNRLHACLLAFGLGIAAPPIMLLVYMVVMFGR